MRLNDKPLNPAKPKPSKGHRCFDGEAGCDLDGTVNNECVFDVDVCLRNADAALPSCTPADVTAVTVKGNTAKVPGLADLQTAANALLPASTNVCTSDQSITVALKGPNGRGEFKAGKAKVKLDTTAGGARDKDQLSLTCVPHGWPSHGYDFGNGASSSIESAITPNNVATMELKWDFTVPSGSMRGVTSTPTVGEKLVYVSSWNGHVYALQKKSGKVKWDLNTGSSFVLGVQASPTLAADGRVVVGDSSGAVYALDGKKGGVLWSASVGDTDPDASHVWGSPTIANGRVFVGRASHNDEPCTPGHLYAFDLDTGAELWRYQVQPDGVCFTDTTVECAENVDCGGPGSPCQINFCDSDPTVPCVDDDDCPGLFLGSGSCVTTMQCAYDQPTACTTNADCTSCVEPNGGGVTSTPSVDASGETVYFSTVGCLSQPSTGQSDSLIAVEADSGAEIWSYRSRPIEQIPEGPNYNDYGFLNGPLLVDTGAKTLAIAGGKDGTLYARDAATGAEEWTNELIAAPEFAGFGLFNGALASDGDLIFAGLFTVDGWTGDHLYAFDAVTGSVEWTDEIGASWGDAAEANGVLFVGTQGAAEVYAYDAAFGTRLATFALPAQVAGRPAIEGGRVYVPYGVFGGEGGVAVYGLPN